MQHLVSNVLLAWAIGCLFGLTGFVTLWGPMTYRYFRDEGYFDKPVWTYRLRRWWRINRPLLAAQLNTAKADVGAWWLVRAEDYSGLLLIVVVFGLLLFGLIVTA